jgi:hypothetical protein
MGKIRLDKHKHNCILTINNKEEMCNLIFKLNGLIKIKEALFKNVCIIYNIHYIEPNFCIKPYDPYLSGLVDVKGSIYLNNSSDRIECNLQLKYNYSTSKLNLNYVIPNYIPYNSYRVDSKAEKYKYMLIKFQQNHENLLYDYFLKNRLYSDFKFNRINKINEYMNIKNFKYSDPNSYEFKTYLDFLQN